MSVTTRPGARQEQSVTITVQINDHERVTINADPKNVKTENGNLTIRRSDGTVIARFRRHIAWWSDDNSSA